MTSRMDDRVSADSSYFQASEVVCLRSSFFRFASSYIFIQASLQLQTIDGQHVMGVNYITIIISLLGVEVSIESSVDLLAAQ